jgi:hypothetical protein
MIDSKFQKKNQKAYKLVLILLLGMTAIAGAGQDLARFLTFANRAHAFADHWLGGAVPPAEARSISVIAIRANKNLN